MASHIETQTDTYMQLYTFFCAWIRVVCSGATKTIILGPLHFSPGGRSKAHPVPFLVTQVKLLQLYTAQKLGPTFIASLEGCTQHAHSHDVADGEGVHELVAQCRLIHSLLCNGRSSVDRRPLPIRLVVAARTCSEG